MTPSVRRFLAHDYPASLALLFIVGAWLPGALLPGGRRLFSHESRFAAFLVIWTGIWSILLGWRLLRLLRLFRIGRIAPARVTVVWVPRWPGRGPFTYNFEFDHHGRSVRARMHVFRMRVAPSLESGETVQALYDPTHPTHAVILELFNASS
jgi:uncharacterized protein DUF3592